MLDTHGARADESARSGILVVAAHPDDEILGLGGQLSQLTPLTLVHATDGAPRDAEGAREAGFATRDGYVQARSAQLDRALAASGVRHARSRELGIAEGEAAHQLAGLVKALMPELAQARVVLTHPYEGGHPDHDACAFAVQAGCALLGFIGAAAPLRLEFACYHAYQGQPRAGSFWDAAGHAERRVELDAPQRARRRAALAQLVLPRAIVAAFPGDVERLRGAPAYDFRRPPPPQELLYERDGGAMNGALWRSRAGEALLALGLD